MTISRSPFSSSRSVYIRASTNGRENRASATAASKSSKPTSRSTTAFGSARSRAPPSPRRTPSPRNRPDLSSEVSCSNQVQMYNLRFKLRSCFANQDGLTGNRPYKLHNFYQRGCVNPAPWSARWMLVPPCQKRIHIWISRPSSSCPVLQLLNKLNQWSIRIIHMDSRENEGTGNEVEEDMARRKFLADWASSPNCPTDY